jgi:hypothetical protein
MSTPGAPNASPQQLLYARWLDVGTNIGFTVLVAAFAAYIFEFLLAHVPVEDLPRYWNLPVEEYLAPAGIESGWGWVAHITKGDYINLVGVAMLASVSIVCYLRLLPLFWKERDRVYTAIVGLEIVVLLLAASGLLDGGH